MIQSPPCNIDSYFVIRGIRVNENCKVSNLNGLFTSHFF